MSYSRKLSVKAVLSTILYVMKKEQERQLHDMYIAECLRSISENTAKLSGGSYINIKYKDILNPPKTETKTAAEIVEDVFTRAGIEVKH